jgi:hypothetical protein
MKCGYNEETACHIRLLTRTFQNVVITYAKLSKKEGDYNDIPIINSLKMCLEYK